MFRRDVLQFLIFVGALAEDQVAHLLIVSSYEIQQLEGSLSIGDQRWELAHHASERAHNVPEHYQWGHDFKGDLFHWVCTFALFLILLSLDWDFLNNAFTVDVFQVNLPNFFPILIVQNFLNLSFFLGFELGKEFSLLIF